MPAASIPTRFGALRAAGGRTRPGRPILTPEAAAGASRSAAVGEPIDEAQRLPLLVDRSTLVVDEAGVEAHLLDGVEVEIRLDLRRLLRPGDPERVVRRERSLQLRKPGCELGARRRE